MLGFFRLGRQCSRFHRARSQLVVGVTLTTLIIASTTPVFATPALAASPSPQQTASQGCMQFLSSFINDQETQGWAQAALVKAGMKQSTAGAVVTGVSLGRDIADIKWQATHGGQVIHFSVTVGNFLVDILGTAGGKPGQLAAAVTRAMSPCVEYLFDIIGNSPVRVPGARPAPKPNPGNNSGSQPSVACPRIPGGCPHLGDKFASEGTSVLRNGVYYGIPEGGYCENPAGKRGVIRNGACDTVGTAI